MCVPCDGENHQGGVSPTLRMDEPLVALWLECAVVAILSTSSCNLTLQ